MGLSKIERAHGVYRYVGQPGPTRVPWDGSAPPKVLYEYQFCRLSTVEYGRIHVSSLRLHSWRGVAVWVAWIRATWRSLDLDDDGEYANGKSCQNG